MRKYGIGDWTIQSVTLQLTASAHGNAMFNSVAAGQFGVSLMANNSWAEGTGTGGMPTSDGITYNSLTSTFINNANDQGLGTFQFVGGTSGTGNYTLWPKRRFWWGIYKAAATRACGFIRPTTR